MDVMEPAHKSAGHGKRKALFIMDLHQIIIYCAQQPHGLSRLA